MFSNILLKIVVLFLIFFNGLSVASSYASDANQCLNEKYVVISGNENLQHLNEYILSHINRELNKKYDSLGPEIVENISYIARALKLSGVQETKFCFYKIRASNGLSINSVSFSVLKVSSGVIFEFFKTRLSKGSQLSIDGHVLTITTSDDDAKFNDINEKNTGINLSKFDKGLSAYNNGYYETAIDIWTPLAEQDHTIAQYNLGYMYFEGIGIIQDYEKGLFFIRKSALKGYAKAEYFLGTIYKKGLGAPKDLAEAKYWFNKSAEKGVVLAQYNLGDLYYSENDGYKDYKEALKWYGKAAEKGYDEAQFKLGLMYFKGLGVKTSYSTATYWFGLAADQGHYEAYNSLKMINNLMFSINRRSKE